MKPGQIFSACCIAIIVAIRLVRIVAPFDTTPEYYVPPNHQVQFNAEEMMQQQLMRNWAESAERDFQAARAAIEAEAQDMNIDPSTIDAE